MLFTSTVFILFFLPLLFLCYFLVPQKYTTGRNVVLFCFSILFYGWGGIRYLGLFALSMTANYLGGYLVGTLKKKSARRLALIGTLAVNLGLLGIFKYTGFVTGTLASLGLPVQAVEIVLPIGISFYTFQGLSYVVDVYRQDAAVQKNPLKVCLYIALFPQLVAGPIVRYTDVERELTARTHSVAKFSQGVQRFMLGFGKKMLLANPMAEIADAAFGAIGTELLTTPVAWVGAIAYAFQIYFDFSAYSDMAIGMGRMFGFHFNENFNYPYTAVSVTDFWRRWHISLSTWFRDYVYIPLGGNRCSPARHIGNLAIVWTLTGLWHGASWNFILWGAYYGVLLILEKYVLHSLLNKLPRGIAWLATFLLVMLGWVLFRAETLPGAAAYLAAMSGAAGGTSDQAVYFLAQYYPEFLLCILGIFPLKKVWTAFMENRRSATLFFVMEETVPKAFALAVFVLSYMKLVSGGFNPFIYFQF